MNIDFLFPQFVYNNILKCDFQNLRNYCYELRKKSEGVHMSNVGGWQSSGFMDENVFFHQIEDDINFVKKTLQLTHLKLFLQNCWFNINYKNNYNRQHVHPGSFLSGVLYMKVPKNSGNIVFLDHSFNIRTSYEENFRIQNELPLNNVFSKEWKYTPTENLLLIFPSWLEHYVEPNMSDEERISIAFNIGVKK
jgi:uncharacterized protein (TIGR02466 family)